MRFCCSIIIRTCIFRSMEFNCSFIWVIIFIFGHICHYIEIQLWVCWCPWKIFFYQLQLPQLKCLSLLAALAPPGSFSCTSPPLYFQVWLHLHSVHYLKLPMLYLPFKPKGWKLMNIIYIIMKMKTTLQNKGN